MTATSRLNAPYGARYFLTNEAQPAYVVTDLS